MRKLLMLALVGGTIAGTAGIAASYAEEAGDTYELLNLFGDVFERVRKDYVEPVKDVNLVEAAINGMLTSLDPHSSYLNEKSFKEMQVQTKGEFGGLGIEVTMENGLVKVVSPIDDTPAYKAGVQPGDYISHINDEPVLGMMLSEAVEKMRGPVNSDVKITLLREGSAEPIDVALKRAVIKIHSVKTRPSEEGIAYIRITSFSEQTYETMKAELEKAKKQPGGVKGLVLDLRNDPGGLLEQAIAVSDAFLDRGEIVSTRERDTSRTKRYSATPGDLLSGAPIVVIINSGSASASEIVAGALQDHKRAVILGTRSFGKGSVQTVIPLPGHGAMRLTTSRYYTPSGHSIQAKGITPDIVVEQAKIQPLKKERELLEADLRRRLENTEDQDKDADKNSKESKAEKAKREEEQKKLIEQLKKPKDEKEKKAKEARGELDPQEDFQLSRALDLLRALTVYKQQGQP